MERFSVGFLHRKCMPKAIGRKVSDKQKVLEKPIRNRCRRSCDRCFFEQKSLKNRVFVGTSFSVAFWKDLGRVWGSPNHRFSHFSRCFFDAEFKVRSGRRKKRPKTRKRRKLRNFGPGFRWSPGSWGEIIERGSQNISDGIIETWPSRSGPGILILV